MASTTTTTTGSNNNSLQPNNNNNNNNITTTSVESSQHAATTPNDGSSIGTAAILNRLKEIESTNQALQATIDRMKTDTQSKDEKIKALSADKRRDMEQMIETAIDNWLNSLTGVQEDVRKQFRQGITKIAKEADMENAAWEIVCNASEAHSRNVKQIETLVNTCAEQGKTIESLLQGGSDPSFSSDASRTMAKRQRISEPMIAPTQTAATTINNNSSNDNNHNHNNGDAWDLFSNMMREDTRSIYY